MRINRVFWGDGAGVHCATMLDDYQGAVTLADCLSRGNYAPYGVTIIEAHDDGRGEHVVSEFHGVRGALSRQDVLTLTRR